MSELTPHSLEFLNAHRNAGTPNEEDRARIQRRLFQSLAVTPLVLGMFTRAQLKTWFLMSCATLVLTSVLVSMVGKIEKARVEVRENSDPLSLAEKVTVSKILIKSKPIDLPKRLKVKSVAAHPAALPPESKDAAVEDSETALRREINALQLAKKALRSGRFAETLSIAHAYNEEFANTGQLVPEVWSVATEALCEQKNENEAKALSAKIEQRFPNHKITVRQCWQK